VGGFVRVLCVVVHYVLLAGAYLLGVILPDLLALKER